MSAIHINGLKVAGLVVIFAVGMAGGLVALGSRRNGRTEMAFSIGATLAGGIFLGAGLMHMLPDSVVALNDYFAGVDFPIGYLIAAVGFLAVLFIEEILFGEAHSGAAQIGETAEAAVAAPGRSCPPTRSWSSSHSIRPSPGPRWVPRSRSPARW